MNFKRQVAIVFIIGLVILFSISIYLTFTNGSFIGQGSSKGVGTRTGVFTGPGMFILSFLVLIIGIFFLRTIYNKDK